MQYNAMIFYRAKVHNYDLEERSFYIVRTKGAFDRTKALGSKERCLPEGGKGLSDLDMLQWNQIRCILSIIGKAYSKVLKKGGT